MFSRHGLLKVKAAFALASFILLLAAVASAMITTREKTIGEPPAGSLTSSNEPQNGVSVSTQQSSEDAPSDIRVVLVAMRPDGVEPGELQLTAGQYLFVINNRTGLDELNLVITREGGVQFREAKITGRRHNWKKIIDLTPGAYLVTERDHPTWMCRVVVSR